MRLHSSLLPRSLVVACLGAALLVVSNGLSTNCATGTLTVLWGTAGDIPVAADYDGWQRGCRVGAGLSVAVG